MTEGRSAQRHVKSHRERERERESDFEAIESQLALRRLYTRHKPRTSSHLPLPPFLYTTSPRSLLHHLWPSRPDRGPQTHINPPLSRMASPFVTNMFKIPADPPILFSIFGLQSVDPWTALPCVCVCVCVCLCVLLCLYVCGWVGGDAPLACTLLS